MRFTGKLALVTGAAQGIGLASAKKLLSEGVNVIITDINEAQASEQAEKLSAEYEANCYSAKMDVSNAEEVKETIGALKEKYGTIDILVNNAGVCFAAKPLSEITEEEWINVFKINLLGMVNCTTAVVEDMKANKYGKIVNMSSSSGFTGGISVSASYSVSKAGVMALTKNMAKQFGPYNISVNALSPGIIKTAMTENLPYDMNTIALHRFAEVEEVADLVAFLSSDESSYLAGNIVDINGGLYMR